MTMADEKARQYQLIRQALKGDMLVDEPLSQHTSFRIGGPADVYYYPPDEENLAGSLALCRGEGIPLFIIGNGTDILVSDGGFRGLVADLSKGFRNLSCHGGKATAGAGVELKEFLVYLTERGLSGMENLAGIPGAVGGCIRLNAGAFGSEMKDRLEAVRFMEPSGAVTEMVRNEIAMEYRRTSLPADGAVLGACFMLQEGNPREMEAVQNDILARRKEKQPLSFPSAGSVFKRPPGGFAGSLIEEAGCKGLRIGDAMVSKKHANFIVNVHYATAEDILRLIDEVRDRVFHRFAVALELEIQLVGFSES
jgi:UDP-N-acetylmuramate dehydrogenase